MSPGSLSSAAASLLRKVDVAAAAKAGIISVIAYTAVMKADQWLTGSKVDDLILLGRPVVPNRPALAEPVGAALHLANGAVIGLAYATLAHDRLPGPLWLRGLTALMVENVGLYPLAIIGPKVHPAIRDGQLDDYWTWPAFAESFPPHITYGLLIGPLYEHFRRT